MLRSLILAAAMLIASEAIGGDYCVECKTNHSITGQYIIDSADEYVSVYGDEAYSMDEHNAELERLRDEIDAQYWACLQEHGDDHISAEEEGYFEMYLNLLDDELQSMHHLWWEVDGRVHAGPWNMLDCGDTAEQEVNQDLICSAEIRVWCETGPVSCKSLANECDILIMLYDEDYEPRAWGYLEELEAIASQCPDYTSVLQ